MRNNGVLAVGADLRICPIGNNFSGGYADPPLQDNFRTPDVLLSGGEKLQNLCN
jgi:hypothetical protein